MKSADQHAFIASGTANGAGFRVGKRRLPLRRLFNFSLQYTRCTRLWPQRRPCRRSRLNSFGKPSSGRWWANCSNCSTISLSRFGRRRYRYTDRLKLTAAQARRSVNPGALRNSTTSSRLIRAVTAFLRSHLSAPDSPATSQLRSASSGGFLLPALAAA